MKNKFITITIIGLVVILLSVVGYAILKANKNKPEETNTEVLLTKNNIDSLVKRVNDLNQKFTSENLSNEGSYDYNDNHCELYLVDTPVKEIEEIQKLYNRPLEDDSLYNVSTSFYEDGAEVLRLYICKPANCKLENINTYKILEEKENVVSIKINDKYDASLTKLQDEWKFDKPVIICK